MLNSVTAANICSGMSWLFGIVIASPRRCITIAIKLPMSKQKSKTGLFRLMTLNSTAQASKNGIDSISRNHQYFSVPRNLVAAFIMMLGKVVKKFL